MALFFACGYPPIEGSEGCIGEEYSNASTT